VLYDNEYRTNNKLPHHYLTISCINIVIYSKYEKKELFVFAESEFSHPLYLYVDHQRSNTVGKKYKNLTFIDLPKAKL